MKEGLDAVRALLSAARLEPGERIAANDRATVERARAVYADGSVSRLIVKRYAAAGEGWVRECAALSALPPGLRVPHLVAAAPDPPVLVTEDLGAGASVADALLGDDPHVAETALHEWAAALADLHAATRGSREAFRAALAERSGAAPMPASRVSSYLDDAVRVLDGECPALGVRVPPEAFDELHGLGKRLGGAGLAALTPADACPDNNVRTTDGLVLVDFEGAQWRHLAWDVAYLLVPWPTCWCAWRMPDDVAERAVQAYVQAAAGRIPEVAEAAFRADVEAAVVGWALITTTWFIGNALGSDPPLHPPRPTPSRRAMILHRLDRAARSEQAPAVAELAAELSGHLRGRWGEVRLEAAPAFRAAQ
jgi:hypothetical protein